MPRCRLGGACGCNIGLRVRAGLDCSSPCILSDNDPGALRAISCARLLACERGARLPLWPRVAGIVRRCADIMPCSAHNLGALSKTAQLRLRRVARGTDELLLQYLESSVLAFGAWSPTRRGVGAAGSWVSHFVWDVQYCSAQPAGASVTSTLWRCNRLPCRQRHSVSPIRAAVASLPTTVAVS